MGNYRTTMDIIADILRVAKGGATRTQIVYRANLNFTIAKKRLDILIKLGYIRVEGNLFHVTDRTDEFYECYELYNRLLGK